MMMRLLPVVGLVLFVLGVMVIGSTNANPMLQICNVPSTYSTIQDAVSDLTCATVEVEKGRFLENIIVDRTLTINGQGTTNTIIDGNASGRVFEVKAGAGLTLSNLSITNGLSPYEPGSGRRQPGAGISISDGELVLIETAITNNRGGIGAGIKVKDSKIIIQDSTISGNRPAVGSSFGGGGISIVGQSDGKITNSTIQDNHSESYGGGIHINKGTLAISDSSFVNNEAARGGALENEFSYGGNEAGTVNVDYSTFTGNKSSEGGAIHNDHEGIMVIAATTISDSSGGISAISNDGQLTLLDSNIMNNNVRAIGNGISGNMMVLRSVILGNQRDGGVRNQGTMTIKECIFERNRSNDNGGAVRNGGQLSIVDSLFKDNEALSEGGAIDSYYGDVTITGSSFIHNVAAGSGTGSQGGAIFNERSNVSIDRSTFFDNHSGFTGGAIANWHPGDFSITNSTISHNSAGQSGGAVFNDSSSLFFISNSTLYNNHAGDHDDDGATLHLGWNHVPDFKIVNSIIIADGRDNCISGYSIQSLGHNIFNDNTCNSISSDQIDTSVVLLPLYYEDGKGLVYQLLPGSAAIDAGRVDTCPTTDQRSALRPLDGNLDGNAVCDIGAYEFDPANPPDIDQIYLPVISDW